MLGRCSVFLEGALGGVMVDAPGAKARMRSTTSIADRIALQRPVSGAKTCAKMVVKVVPQTAPRAHYRPLCNLLRCGFAKQPGAVLIVAGTVRGQMVRIGLLVGKISFASRLNSQAKEIKQLAVKKMGGSSIG